MPDLRSVAQPIEHRLQLVGDTPKIAKVLVRRDALTMRCRVRVEVGLLGVVPPELLGEESLLRVLWVASSSFRSVRSIGLEEPAVDLTLCLLYTSPSPRDLSTSRMPSSA